MSTSLSLYFDSEKSIFESLKTQDYDLLRAHYMTIRVLCDKLGITNIQDFHYHKYPTDGFVVKNTVLEYLPEVNIGTENNDIGIILHAQTSDVDRLVHFLKSCNKVIYYNSDPEFVNQPFLDNRMVLRYILDHPNSELSKLFNSKVVCIITGIKNQYDMITRLFNKPTYYIPQLINPDIPVVESIKHYDAFLINTSKTYKDIQLKLLDRGYKVLSLVNHPGAIVPGVDAMVCSGSGCNYKLLLELVSKCRYYVCTNTYWSDIRTKDLNYAIHSYGSKYLESYYGGTIPVPGFLDEDGILKFMDEDHKYSDFNRWMNKNFSINTYLKEFDAILKNLSE